MKKTIRILIPILLSVIIIASCLWYFVIYDREFTRDILLSCARFCESQGQHTTATWFYNQAYAQSGNSDAVAIELAEQYKNSGNYTKAEFTLTNAIADGGGIDLYIALCNTYVEQDKLLDAVNMLNNVTNPEIKEQLNQLRPTAPSSSPAPGFYNQYISVEITSSSDVLYVSQDGEYPSIGKDQYIQPMQMADGENTLYAISIGDNGLVSPLSVFGYTVGGIIKPVDFQDAAIEAKIRETLNLSQSTIVFTNDLWKITEFTVPAEAKSYADIAHMSFLEKLVIDKAVATELHYLSSLANLTELRITDTNITSEDMASIAALPKLKNLTLSNCGLTSIPGFVNAANMEHLDLNNNTVRSIDPVGEMVNLQELNMQHNAMISLQAIRSLSKLKKLDVSYNAVTGLSEITGLTELTWLNAEHNAITDLGSIDNLSALTYLSLSGNQIADVSKIAGCSGLTELNLAENALTDIGVLNALKNLMYLDVSHNQIEAIPTWEKDCALVTINGSHNKIKSLAPLAGLKHLNNIHMDYNADIESVKELAGCPVLIEVNVYATKVKDVTSLTNQSVIVNYNPVQ